jgi:hypothetical protein
MFVLQVHVTFSAGEKVTKNPQRDQGPLTPPFYSSSPAVAASVAFRGSTGWCQAADRYFSSKKRSGAVVILNSGY